MGPRPRGYAALAATLLLLRALSSADCTRQSGPAATGCPAGHFVQQPCAPPCEPPPCTPCPPGTYMERENHRYEHCVRCRFCDEQALQEEVQKCSPVADTRCGCRPGSFPDCPDSGCNDAQELFCSTCADCAALDRRPGEGCSRGPEECGGCLDGFYEHKNSCVSCPTITLKSCPTSCAAVCGWRQMFWAQVLLAVLVVPLLLGSTSIYLIRTYRCHAARPVVSEEAGTEAPRAPQDAAALLQDTLPSGSNDCTAHLVANSWVSSPPQTHEVPGPAIPWVKDWLPSPVLGPPARPPAVPPAGREAAVLQPGPQLYDVIDAVPARRWKEFVRTLGLREAEIEAVEVEVDRFRDQQYEMLKRWRQQESAGLGAVYRALERMGLDGCAEDLRSRLQRGA